MAELQIRNILVEYSHIPERDIRQHVYATREKLWSIRSYPCTSLGVWLSSELPMNPAYAEILTRVKSGSRFVDIGAFMGYNLRRLMFDGCPTDNIFAVDIINHWDIGFEFFRDRGRWDVRFIEADVLRSRDSDELKELYGTVDVVNISHVMHQWPRPTQIECVKQLVKLTRPGALIVGYQAGNVRSRPLERQAGVELKNIEDRPYVHNADSFGTLFHDAGQEVRVRFETKARLMEWVEGGRKKDDCNYMGEEMKLLEFVVRRGVDCG